MVDISICCTCFNHEKYIAKALDGMLMQKGEFTMEILVHDDASTDASASIIKQYQAQYPNLIKPIFQTENQYSKGIPINETFNFSRSKGTYIALCEGDDCWSDPLKLQKQWQYMQSHEHCTFCFTNAMVEDVQNGETRPFLPYYAEDIETLEHLGEKLSVSDVLNLSFIPTASFMFKTKDYTANQAFLATPFPYGDLRFKVLFTSLGYAHFLNEPTCVYHLNVAGSALSLWKKQKRTPAFKRYLQAMHFFDIMNKKTQGQFSYAFEEKQRTFARFALDYVPSLKAMKNPMLKQAFKTLPWSKQCKVLLKAVLLKDKA